MMAAVVAAMTLGELLGAAAGSTASLTVTDLVSDSRQVTPGSAFVALAGERSHGLDHADAALAAGAAVVLHEPVTDDRAKPARGLAVPDLHRRLGELAFRFYGAREPAGALIGITGTNGKTTVAWLTAQAMSGLGRSCAYVGTLGYGMPGALEAQALTTPDCLSLHRRLAAVGTDSAAVELSSHALAQDRVAGVPFSIAAFTNLSRDHLDWHGSMERYFAAKARLFERDGLAAAVVNLDDDYGPALLGRLAPGLEVVTVSLSRSAGATLEASVASRGLAGLTLDIRGDHGQARIESALIGGFNAENLALALGILAAAGYAPDAAAAALGTAAAAPGRMEVFGGPPAAPWVVVDYAHTPRALERALGELATIASGEIHCVFGCGGDRDRGKRAPMGEAAARYAAHVVLTDDNPRGEDPAAIVADIKAGIARHPDLRVRHERALAIVETIASAAPGDVVLVAGKGHETTQVAGDVVRACDDRELVRRTLEGNA
jgi:UDP-N-acetylmuramoyl-L-alanyl-D-glutamate--2,6-diaminopimelate ligase